MDSQAVKDDAGGVVNLEHVIPAIVKLPCIDLILHEAVGYGDLNIAESYVVNGAVFAIDEVHHCAVGTHALNGNIAEAGAVFSVKAECGIGICCGNSADVNILDVGTAGWAVCGTEFKRTQTSFDCDV